VAKEEADGNVKMYIVIKTGSSKIGRIVVEYYHGKACGYKKVDRGREGTIDELKKQGRQSEIQEVLKNKSARDVKSKKVLNSRRFLIGSLLDDYLFDMKIVR
jgi:predicted restriction endonuclease